MASHTRSGVLRRRAFASGSVCARESLGGALAREPSRAKERVRASARVRARPLVFARIHERSRARPRAPASVGARARESACARRCCAAFFWSTIEFGCIRILENQDINDPGRTRTCNPRLRRPMPYPLGHGARCYRSFVLF